MPRDQQHHRRDPQNIHAWIIGAEMSSLAAAVLLIHDARVPGSHIHILDNGATPAAAVKYSKKDYELQLKLLSSVIDRCTAHVMSRVPSASQPEKSLLDLAMETGSATRPPQHGSDFVMQDACGLRKIQRPASQLRLGDRKDILKVMLDEERNLESESIQDCFGNSFFNSDLWQLFSKRFMLQPWHSAIELHRCLRRYLDDAQSGQIKQLMYAQQIMTESVLEPVKDHLQKKGVEFRLETLVSDLKLLTDDTSTYVHLIEGTENGKSFRIPMSPEDIVIVALGSASSGSLIGCNGAPPSPISARAESLMNNSWVLWFKLARKSPTFGNPATFCTHISESKVEVFTVTLKGVESVNLYARLMEKMGTGSSLFISHSNWSLCIFLPCRPLLSDPPKNDYIIWGYGLTPDECGNFIQKPMCRCAGQEILSELLSHLGLASDQVLSTATTVSCLMPLATSPLLRRHQGDRPDVIPQNTANIALIGQFTEMMDEAACSLEYGIRSAQMAVYLLMDLHRRLPKVRVNAVAGRYGKHS